MPIKKMFNKLNVLLSKLLQIFIQSFSILKMGNSIHRYILNTYCTNIQNIHRSLLRLLRIFQPVSRGRIVLMQIDRHRIQPKISPSPSYYNLRHSAMVSIRRNLEHLHRNRIPLRIYYNFVIIICSTFHKLKHLFMKKKLF